MRPRAGWPALAGWRPTIDLGRVAEGEWRLALPSAPTAVLLDNQPLAATDLGQGVYSLRLAVNRQAPLTVLWA